MARAFENKALHGTRWVSSAGVVRRSTWSSLAMLRRDVLSDVLAIDLVPRSSSMARVRFQGGGTLFLTTPFRDI